MDLDANATKRASSRSSSFAKMISKFNESRDSRSSVSNSDDVRILRLRLIMRFLILVRVLCAGAGAGAGAAGMSLCCL
jgi:hypothetical protein